MKRLLPILIVLGFAACCVAEAPTDVPMDHWAYDAVRDLANRGFVLGYPDGSFLGNRSLTRYEFATVLKRILDNIDQELVELKTEPAASAHAATEAGVSKDDITKVNKLVDEFKVELAVIGTRLDKVEATVSELHSKLETIDAIVSDPEGALESTRSDVSKLKKISVSGYLQTRYQNFDSEKEDTAENKDVDSFLIRRARVKVTGKPTDRSTVVVQFDAGKNSVSLKDSYLQYALGQNSMIAPSFTIGQFNWPFGYDVVYSSSRRETPERALIARRMFPGERDQGAKLMSAENSSLAWQIGVFNGTGTEKSSAKDKNNAKDIVANAKWSSGTFDFGISGYWGKGAWKEFGGAYLSDVRKVRYGADLQIYLNNVTLKAEYIRGKGVDTADPLWDQDDYVDGYYGQLNWNLNPKDTLVARYSSMSKDPVKPKLGRRSALELGYLRWLDQNSRMKLFYKWNYEQRNEFFNDGLVAEWVVTY